MNNISSALKNCQLDTVIMRIPLVATVALGFGSGYLERSQNPYINSLGSIGTQVVVALTVAAVVPLAVWSLAKNIFSKILMEITFRRYNCLNQFHNRTKIHLAVSLSVLGIAPLIVMNSAKLIDIFIQIKSLNLTLSQSCDRFAQTEAYGKIESAFNTHYRHLDTAVN